MVRNLWQEFKTFAFKGNMIDLAVGIIIGAAFSGVVKSLVDHIFMPLLAAAGAGGKGYESWSYTLNGSKVEYGQFIGAVIHFLIVAAVVFVTIVKLLGTIVKKTEAPAAPDEPTIKECPHCLSEVPIKARRCKYCTSELSGGVDAGEAAARQLPAGG